MAIKFRESPDSRDLHYGAQGGGQTFKATALTDAGETEGQVWLAALQHTSPYFNGFIRNDIQVRRKGATHIFDVVVEYGTTGIGGGDQPLGGTGSDGGAPLPPTAPASDTTPLTSGWSFSIRAPRLHLTQSRNTLQAVKRGGGDAENFMGRVGVDRDRKTVGVDWPPEPSFTWKRTVAMPNVTRGYLEVLAATAGRPNDAPFYGWDTYCLILLEADGQYTQSEGWSVTFGFGVELGEGAIEICTDLPGEGDTLSKRGFDYLWILEDEIPEPGTGRNIVVPSAAYVEELIRPANYSFLNIGT